MSASRLSRPSSVHNACSRVVLSGAAQHLLQHGERRTHLRVRRAAAAPCRATSHSGARGDRRARPGDWRDSDGLRRAPRRLVHDSIDAPVAERGLQLAREDLIAQVLGDVVAMLDDAVIHVDEVERAVRRVRQIHRPEALVGRGQELGALVRLPRDELRAVVMDDDAADEVGGGIDDEDVAAELRGKAIAAIDRGRADGGVRGEPAVGAEHAGLVAAVDARRRPRPARPTFTSLFVAAQGLVAAARSQQARVPREVRRRNQIDVQDRLVRVAVDPSGIVLRCAPLAARERLAHLERPLLQPQVDVGLGRVHPVVERPEQAVRVVLDVGVEPPVGVGDELLGVGAQVAVGVAGEPEVGRLADEHAAIEHLQRPRQNQLVEEDRLLVHLPVVVRDPRGR